MAAQQSLFESAHKGDFDTVQVAVDENPQLVTKRDDNGRCLLHWAALSGNFKLVEYLIEKNSPIDADDDTQSTPLILAAAAGRTEIVKLLISNKADINHKTDQGHSALQYACSKSWKDIAEILLENHADINIADIRGATPLHRAASRGNLAIVQLLLKHKETGPLKINARDAYGNTPLHLACEEDRREEAKVLVENGGDLLGQNSEKKSPRDLCSRSLLQILSSVKSD